MRESTIARHKVVKDLFNDVQRKHPKWKRSAVIEEVRKVYPYSEGYIEQILCS